MVNVWMFFCRVPVIYVQEIQSPVSPSNHCFHCLYPKKDTADINVWRNVRTFSLKKYFHIIYMVQWLIIHLYIHRTSVLRHFQQYKLTFFFFKSTLHIGKFKTALNVHVESFVTARSCHPCWAAPDSWSGGRGAVTEPTWRFIKCSTSSKVRISGNSFFPAELTGKQIKF